MSFIGVDLHTTSFTVCRLAADGSEAFETWQLAAADLDRFCLSLDADDEIAVEATGNSAWFRDPFNYPHRRFAVLHRGRCRSIERARAR